MTTQYDSYDTSAYSDDVARHRYYDPSNDVSDYYHDIFNAAAGQKEYTENVCLMEEKLRTSCSLKRFLNDESRKKILKRIWAEDLYYTPNTYCPSTEQNDSDCDTGNMSVPKEDETNQKLIHCDVRDDNMFRLCVWGIDIDFKSKFEKERRKYVVRPEDFFDYLMDTVGDRIPLPNWIEYSHQLRLIYILTVPISRKTKGQRQADQLIRGLRKVQQRICDILNEELDCGAEIQKIWYRVPGSFNTKNGQRYQVKVKKISEDKWTVQELMNEYLPAITPEQRQNCQENNGITDKSTDRIKDDTVISKAGKNIYKINNTRTLQLNRIADYKILAKKPDIPRETLLKLYGVAWISLNEDDADDVVDVLLDFNQRLVYPLKDREIMSKFRTLPDLMREKHYKYRNTTIMDELGIDDAYCELHGLYLHTGKQRKPATNKKTKQQKMSERHETIKSLYLVGVNRNEIVKQVGCSFRTVTNEITTIRKETSASAVKSA